MANISYKTTEKPAIQKAICKAIDWVGSRQTSYSELARMAKCMTSDSRYAVLDLLEKGYITRQRTKGYAGATRGYRYAYTVTEAGKKWMDEPLPEKKEEKPAIVPGLFV